MADDAAPASAPVAALAYTDEEKAEVVRAVKAEIQGEISGDAEATRFATDATIERFSRAMNYDVTKATDFLRRAIKWRAEKRPWELRCEGCQGNMRCHSLRCIGTDKEVRPVLYHHFGQAVGRANAVHNNQHLMRILEDCTRFMDEQNPPVAQWVWIFDFHGYSIWDNNPTTVMQAAQYLPMHPNRLFKVILLDAPSLFNAMWSVASGYLSEITKAKIVFCSLAELQGAMEPWAGKEASDWVYNEAVENRELASRGEEGNKEHWTAPANPGAHDPRGMKSWVTHPKYFCTADWYKGEGGAQQEIKKQGSWLWG